MSSMINTSVVRMHLNSINVPLLYDISEILWVDFGKFKCIMLSLFVHIIIIYLFKSL